jgi:hypothetical protein
VARRHREKPVHDMPELVEAGPSDTIRNFHAVVLDGLIASLNKKADDLRG